MSNELDPYQPLFEDLGLNKQDQYLIAPFFTNLDKPVYAIPLMPPEVVGALCSRSSRAKGDLRTIFLQEFITPFLEEDDEYGRALQEFIDFLHKNPIDLIFANPKGREFYIKWLAQYGDDSIAQMSGTHLVYSGLSQVAIKHLEDQRIGIAPIEKSTRYIDFSNKINNHYQYYTPPELKSIGLDKEYESIMDMLFETYKDLSSTYLRYLQSEYPNEKNYVLKTKAYDTVRGLLPMSTLGQVAFYGNGQSFEYFLHRTLNHPLGEIRWVGGAALQELKQVIPAFVRRAEGAAAEKYRTYYSERSSILKNLAQTLTISKQNDDTHTGPVHLLEYDPDAENKIITSLLYPEQHNSFETLLQTITPMTSDEKKQILDTVLGDRAERWYKMPRAFENAYLRFEITMNIGSWRDLHRHRMQTQFREYFTTQHGYKVPKEFHNTPLADSYIKAMEKVNILHEKIANHDEQLAQYATTLAHKVRFIQYQNLRAFFWEAELRTISQGHPDYRFIEHEKIRLLQEVYPLLMEYLQADMQDYDFARRGTEERAEMKAQGLSEYLNKANQG